MSPGSRTLPPIDRVTVRHARSEDVEAIAEIHVRSWSDAYRDILPAELLDGLSASEREVSWRALMGVADGHRLILVAEDGGGVIRGFCSVATPSHDPGATAKTAEIGACYVDPGYWRRGAGSAMLTAAFAELAGRRFRDAILWVLPENHGALAFYDRFDFAVEKGVEKREERSGRPVIRLRARVLPDLHLHGGRPHA